MTFRIDCGAYRERSREGAGQPHPAVYASILFKGAFVIDACQRLNAVEAEFYRTH